MNNNKFITIYEDLKEKITSDHYQLDTFLPSENELAASYQASRETVRKALTLLQNNGLIQKVRGKGSKVIFNKAIRFEVEDLISFKEQNAKLDQAYQTQVIRVAKVEARDFPHVKEALGLSSFDNLIEVVRARMVDGHVNIVDTDYFNPAIIPHLDEEIAQDSIYGYIEKDLGLEISHSTKTITFDKASNKLVQLFQSLEPPYTATITSIVYLTDTRPFQYNISQHRPSSFKFTTFSRRIK